KVAVIAGDLLVGLQRDHAPVRTKFVVAPDESARDRRGEDDFRIVTIARRDRLQLVSLRVDPVTGVLDSIQAPVPYDDAAARMSRADQSIHDRVHDVAMRRKELAADRANLDADLVVRRNERAPGACQIRL